MKRLVLVGALVGAVATGSAFQLTAAAQTEKPAQAGAGHTAPKAQPATEAAPTAPEGQVALGTVRIPKAVKADGKPLAAGTYQVRLTTENASPGREGPDRGARALGGIRQGRQGRRPRSGDGHPAVGNLEGPEGRAAGERRGQGRNAEGRRLPSGLDQPQRQSLSDALRGLGSGFTLQGSAFERSKAGGSSCRPFSCTHTILVGAREKRNLPRAHAIAIIRFHSFFTRYRACLSSRRAA